MSTNSRSPTYWRRQLSSVPMSHIMQNDHEYFWQECELTNKALDAICLIWYSIHSRILCESIKNLIIFNWKPLFYIKITSCDNFGTHFTLIRDNPKITSKTVNTYFHNRFILTCFVSRAIYSMIIHQIWAQKRFPIRK